MLAGDVVQRDGAVAAFGGWRLYHSSRAIRAVFDAVADDLILLQQPSALFPGQAMTKIVVEETYAMSPWREATDTPIKMNQV